MLEAAPQTSGCRRQQRRRTAVSRRFRLAPWTAALLLAACGNEPTVVPQTRFEDLLLDQRLWRGRPHQPQSTSCGDETRFAVELDDGDEVTVRLPLGAAPFLTLSGCVERSDHRFGPAGGTLSLWATGSSGAADPAPLDAVGTERAQQWWSRTYDLSGLAGDSAVLRLRLELPEERQFFLGELLVEHRLPVPAPRRAAEAGAVPQVLLISIDTLRADALGVYGSRNATPALDSLAAQGQTWLTHYAAATWTKPSHAALLTGQPPEVGRGLDEPLDPTVTTLAERLQRQGLATAGLVHDCVWLNPKFDFDRGFDEYASVRWQLPKMVRQVSNWIAEHRDQPFFYFSHNFDVHSDFHRLPYESPGISIITVKELFGFTRYGCRQQRCASARLAEIAQGRLPLLPGEEKALRYLYDRGVEAMDRQLGVLFRQLKEMGVWDRLTIVVTSDHGESFGEHGELLHDSPWEHVLRVPLIIKWPDGRHAGSRDGRPTSSLDVVPTLLDAYGYDLEGLPGSPLPTRRRDRPVFAGTVEKVVVRENLKAIFNIDGRDLLFDLAQDPGELHDLSIERPQVLEEMKRLMRANHHAFLRQRREAEKLKQRDDSAAGLTEDEKRHLRSLGYLGGS